MSHTGGVWQSTVSAKADGQWETLLSTWQDGWEKSIGPDFSFSHYSAHKELLVQVISYTSSRKRRNGFRESCSFTQFFQVTARPIVVQRINPAENWSCPKRNVSLLSFTTQTLQHYTDIYKPKSIDVQKWLVILGALIFSGPTWQLKRAWFSEKCWTPTFGKLCH